MSEPEAAETPIDPAFEKVRRKMVRLLALSIAVLFVGLIAVLSAVVYRSADRPEASARAGTGRPAPGTVAPIDLPAGARISESALDGGHALIRLTLVGGAEEFLVVDLHTGEVVSRHPVLVGVQADPAAAPASPPAIAN